MYLIRPIKQDDLDGLMKMLEYSGYGLTSLPKDPEVLLRRIKHSELSFEHAVINRPSGEHYLFVMEDLHTGNIIGINGIISKIGGFEPYFFYELQTEIRKSGLLEMENKIETLHVHKVYNGPAEIGSLFLDPRFRKAQIGRFLSISRFVFIAENREFFEDDIIAEMRGRVDDTGHSPFWEAVGKKFFKIPFPEADYLTVKSKSFIEELLPEYPIIIDLLPEEAKNVVGEVHPNTEPAKHVLMEQGFHKSNLVGIFEPGPVLHAKVDDIKTVQETIVCPVSEIVPSLDDNKRIIASRGCKDFRAVLGNVEMIEDKKETSIKIEQLSASNLGVKIGDSVRVAHLKA